MHWQARCWKEALVVAARAKYNAEKLLEIAETLALKWVTRPLHRADMLEKKMTCVMMMMCTCIVRAYRLTNDNRHAEAAVLFEQYLHDHERAIAAYIQGSHWVRVSIYLSVCLPVCLSVCLPARLPACVIGTKFPCIYSRICVDKCMYSCLVFFT